MPASSPDTTLTDDLRAAHTPEQLIMAAVTSCAFQEAFAALTKLAEVAPLLAYRLGLLLYETAKPYAPKGN